MRFQLLIFGLCCLLSAAAADIDPMDEFIRRALELIRSKMKTGAPDLNIPVMDPYMAPNISQNINAYGLAATLNISNVNVSGLSSFLIKSVHFDLKTVTVNVSIVIPILRIKGNYSLEGKWVKIFPLHNDGNATINVTGLELNMTSSVFAVDNKPQLRSLDLKLNFQDIEVNFANLLKAVNQVLSFIVKQYLKIQRSEIEKSLDDKIKNFVNKMLKKIDLRIRSPALYGSSKQKTAKANQWVDQILKNAQPALRKRDPLKLPYIKRSFKKKIGFFKVKGSAELKDGTLRGLSTLHRTGNVILSTNSKEITISANLGISNVAVYYKSRVKLLHMRASPKLYGKIQQVSVYFKISQNMADGKRRLVDFKITQIKKPKIKIRGLSIFGYLLSFIANMARGPIVKSLKNSLEKQARKELAKVIQSAKLPF